MYKNPYYSKPTQHTINNKYIKNFTKKIYKKLKNTQKNIKYYSSTNNQ